MLTSREKRTIGREMERRGAPDRAFAKVLRATVLEERRRGWKRAGVSGLVGLVLGGLLAALLV